MSRHPRTIRIVFAILLLAALLPLPASADDGDDVMPMGCQPSPPGEYPMVAPDPVSAPLPPSVDLRSGLPPVGDQGRQNSCVAWAVGYYCKSFQEAREQWWSLDALEHQFSPSFIYNQRPTSRCSIDRGMSIVAALRILQKGALPLSAAPYSASDPCSKPPASALSAAGEYRAGAYAMLFQGAGRANVDQIKAYLAAGAPVILAIPVYNNFRTARPGNAVIGVPPTGSSMLGGHAVLAVGYDATGILIVNSWGTRWGEKGFACLTYEFVRRYSWEGWIMDDVDATAPAPPLECSPLPNPPAGTVQTGPGSYGFTWSGATDNGGSGIRAYRVYWGPDPEGQAPFVETAATSFTCDPAPAGATYYLRVQVVDQAGNASAWRTLYTFQGATVETPPVETLPGDSTSPMTVTVGITTTAGTGVGPTTVETPPAEPATNEPAPAEPAPAEVGPVASEPATDMPVESAPETSLTLVHTPHGRT